MNRIVCWWLLVVACAGPVSAQLVSFGVKGGVPLLDATPSGSDESPRYLVGPSVEFRLPAGFALEADALYRRVGSTVAEPILGSVLVNPLTGGTIPLPALTDRTRGNSWQLPILGKFYAHSHASHWQPYGGAGVSFRKSYYTVESNQEVVSALAGATAFTFVPYRYDYASDIGVGAVLAGGIRFRAGRHGASAELGYTRWGSSDSVIRKNEANFLIGLSF